MVVFGHGRCLTTVFTPNCALQTFYIGKWHLQCSLTGGSLRCPAMSVFLIFKLSSTERPLSHSVATLLDAIADPHPNVLNLDSVMTPFSSTFENKSKQKKQNGKKQTSKHESLDK